MKSKQARGNSADSFILRVSQSYVTINSSYVKVCLLLMNVSKFLILQKNKSPGNDGLTTEFYKAFWHLFGNTLVGSLNKRYQNGELSNSQKQGVITLLLKKDKDKRKSSYRPITLLNVDLKKGSKAIATRLSKVLPDIIGREQAAFVSDRYIGDAVRTVTDIIYLTKYRNMPSLLMHIDFEKAYDSIDHDFLKRS